MTPEAQRIAIAEACGLKNVHAVVIKNVTSKGDDRTCGIASDEGWIPDYLSDLNAMHEAEKVLDYVQRRMYAHQFKLMFNDGNHGWNPNALFEFAHATATQRAEAFLRTLNLWIDE